MQPADDDAQAVSSQEGNGKEGGRARMARAAHKLMQGFKGLDTSGVEADEEQAPPTIAAESKEEREMLSEMEELLKQEDEDAANAPTALKLMCLRGRKYSPARGAKLLPELLQLQKDLDLHIEGTTPVSVDNTKLEEGIKSMKVCNLDTKDGLSRGLVWLRFRFHKPQEGSERDMARVVATVMLQALQDVEVQRHGIAIIQDMTGLKLSNLDVKAGRMMFASVFPRLPMRVGRIYVINPPWIVGQVLLPFFMTFMSRKLKSRIVIITENAAEKIMQHIPSASLPAELGGSLQFDAETWADALIASVT